MPTTDQLLQRMRAIAERRGHVLYDILFRNAGVGMFFVDINKIPPEAVVKPPKEGDATDLTRYMDNLAERNRKRRSDREAAKVVYLYKPTLRQSMVATVARLKKLPITHRYEK